MIENVPSFRKHALFTRIHDTLGEEYDIVDKILSPHEYGAPQRRRRIYIVGIRKAVTAEAFVWPETVPLEIGCTQLISNALTAEEVEQCKVKDKYYTRKLEEWNMDDTPRIVSLSTYALNQGSNTNKHISPCVLASHPGLYAPHIRRLLHPRELLALQGFVGVILPPSLSNNIVRRLAGNAMSVDVLMHIIRPLLKCIGKECESAFAAVKAIA